MNNAESLPPLVHKRSTRCGRAQDRRADAYRLNRRQSLSRNFGKGLTLVDSRFDAVQKFSQRNSDSLKNRERYVNRILRNVIAMVRLAEARVVQLKNSRPLSLPRRSRAESRQSAWAALFASHGERCAILV